MHQFLLPFSALSLQCIVTRYTHFVLSKRYTKIWNSKQNETLQSWCTNNLITQMHIYLFTGCFHKIRICLKISHAAIAMYTISFWPIIAYLFNDSLNFDNKNISHLCHLVVLGLDVSDISITIKSPNSKKIDDQKCSVVVGCSWSM